MDGRGSDRDLSRRGGFKAAAIVCVVEVLENLVFLSNASNFVSYFLKSLHYPPAHASNMVTNFMATSFLLTMLGGFISDSFLTRFKTFVISCVIELMGIILLTIQAYNSKLLPPVDGHQTPSSSQEAMLYAGLYAMALGVGGIKAALPAHGADQLDHNNQREVSAFFNWFFFSLCTGGILSSTVMVWIEDNEGWKISFTISAVVLAVALCIFVSGFSLYTYKKPNGSPFSRIYKVLVSAVRSSRGSIEQTADRVGGRSQEKFKFLDKALNDSNTTEEEVKETRTFLCLLPIFASTILMNCCLAQLQTYSVQQGFIMNRKIGNFEIPIQSLTVIPLTIILLSIIGYEKFAGVFGSNRSGKSSVFQPLTRMGIGLAMASASMAVAAGIEAKRRDAAGTKEILSVFWLGWQYLLLGVSDMLTLGGMLEFFYSEAPENMRSTSTALSWLSTSMGFFLSSVLVTATNAASGRTGKAWLGEISLNDNRLDLFYTLLCVLNFINLLNYIFWAKRY